MLTDKKKVGIGFQLIVRSGSLSEKVQEAVIEGLGEIAYQYTKKVKENLSLSDHSLKQLREMGHPYSVDKPANFPHDDRIVHEQTGHLKQSIRQGAVREESSRKFTVDVTSDDPMIEGIIYGTSRMRPRRFHEKAYEDIKDKYWLPLIRCMKKVDYRITEAIRNV